MSKEDVIESLQLVLADSYALYLKTQTYHWNVTGHNFHGLHLMFEEQYTELGEAIDVIAERIRALDAKVSTSLSKFSKTKTISDPDIDATPDKMLKELAEDQENIVALLNKTASIAAKADDRATEDIAVERIRSHEKNIWQLHSSLEFDLPDIQ